MDSSGPRVQCHLRVAGEQRTNSVLSLYLYSRIFNCDSPGETNPSPGEIFESTPDMDAKLPYRSAEIR
jgi:hypothetical protein